MRGLFGFGTGLAGVARKRMLRCSHLMPDSQPRLARSAGLFGLATMTSRILGLVRDQVLAFYFGAGDINDAFRVAIRIPNLLRDLFAEGAMSAAFVPTFTRQLTLQGRDRAWYLASSVINALILVTGAASARDIGRVMKAAMGALAGKHVDGKRVNDTVRARLAG